MKHAGFARKAGFNVIFWSFVALIAIIGIGVLATIVGAFIVTISGVLAALWILFAMFTLYFFRDPEPAVPGEKNLVVSPGHGRVDVIDDVEEPEFMQGRCRRISMFLSVFDVHVQNAPVAGVVRHRRHKAGKFLSATRTGSAQENERVLLGLESRERPGEKIGVKFIAGVLARRIVPFVDVGDSLERGERIGLIRFGSRVDLYLPLHAKIDVKLGDKLVGGQTVVARFE